jgi:hypothetical protein
MSEKDKADLEMRIGDLHFPELVLDDDGHLLGILGLQELRDANTRGAGQEGDEKVMLARQAAGRCDFGQYLADDAAKRVLCQNVVTDVILPHAYPVFRSSVRRFQGYMP